MPQPKGEVLVPLDESDFLAHCERQEQEIRKLKAVLAEKDIARLRRAGCECPVPLVGGRPDGKVRCRLCNKEEPDNEQIASLVKALDAEHDLLIEAKKQIASLEGDNEILRNMNKILKESLDACYGAVLGPQEPLGEDFQKVLDDNRDKLYEEEDK